MKLDGFGIFVGDMAKMIRFYRDVLGFEIRETESASNVYLVKDGTLFLLYGRGDFEKMSGYKYEYVKGLNGHFEIAPWGQRTCYIADPEGKIVEIGSFNGPFRQQEK